MLLDYVLYLKVSSHGRLAWEFLLTLASTSMKVPALPNLSLDIRSVLVFHVGLFVLGSQVISVLSDLS